MRLSCAEMIFFPFWVTATMVIHVSEKMRGLRPEYDWLGRINKFDCLICDKSDIPIAELGLHQHRNVS